MKLVLKFTVFQELPDGKYVPLKQVCLSKYVNELDSYRMIDIRTIDEVVALPLMGDHDHIPMDQLLNNPECIKDDEVIILVCAAGIRSCMAAEWFRKQGFSKVYSLIGGQPVWNEYNNL